jgi:hypothetical protein
MASPRPYSSSSAASRGPLHSPVPASETSSRAYVPEPARRRADRHPEGDRDGPDRRGSYLGHPPARGSGGRGRDPGPAGCRHPGNTSRCDPRRHPRPSRADQPKPAASGRCRPAIAARAPDSLVWRALRGTSRLLLPATDARYPGHHAGHDTVTLPIDVFILTERTVAFALVIFGSSAGAVDHRTGSSSVLGEFTLGGGTAPRSADRPDRVSPR